MSQCSDFFHFLRTESRLSIDEVNQVERRVRRRIELWGFKDEKELKKRH